MAIDPGSLREARRKAGLSQAQLAAGIMTPQALQKIEAGRSRPTPERLEAIVERLGIPLRRVLAPRRDPREQELAGLELQQRFQDLELLARQMLAERNVRGRTRALARYHLGRALAPTEPREAVRELRQARRQLVQHRLPTFAAEAIDWEAGALYLLQDPRAVAAGRQALASYRRHEDRMPAVEARMLEHIGTFLLQRGEYEEAMASYRSALTVSGAVLDLARLALIYHGMAEAARRAGRTAQGLDYMERAISFYRCDDEIRGGVTANLARAENDYGYQLLRAGRLEQAEQMITAALTHHDQAGATAGRLFALHSMAELRQLQCRPDEALEYVHQLIRAAEHEDAVVSIAEGYRLLGALSFELGDEERFEAAFTRALEVLTAPELTAVAQETIVEYRRIRAAQTPASAASG